MIRLAAACAALIAFAGVSVAKTAAPKPITLTNAEDMLPLPGGRWVLASSMSGGAAKTAGLYAIDTKSGKAKKLYPSGAVSTDERAGCGKELAADVFAGHGISLQLDEKGAGKLYVVNHGGRESVEIFDVTPGKSAAAAPSLKWNTCAIAPEGTLQNSVASTPSGAFYVTVTPKDGIEEMVKGAPVFGDVRGWSPDKGWSAVYDSEMPAPNGIVASPDGKTLYVDSWAGGKLVELTLGDKPSRRALALGFNPDNVRWGSDGALLVAGHDAKSVAAMADCFFNNGAECPIESAIARVDPTTLAITCSHSMGSYFATVGIHSGNELWVGTARGFKIMRLPATALTTCAH